MIIKGKVKKGLGTAKFWIGKISEVFKLKNSIILFEGTLNIELEKPYIIKNPDYIISKEEYGGSQDVLVKKCEILGKEVFAVRAEKNQTKNGDHPITIIEIVSDINLRKEYNLIDGDEIKIKI